MNVLDQPVNPGIGPEGLPTPSLPGPEVAPSCPIGYAARTTRSGQTFTDLLLENDVSYNALLGANPTLGTGQVTAGVRYCAPPAGSRRICPAGSATYILGIGEDFNTLRETMGYSASDLLSRNPSLAPGDFRPGRVVCVPE